MFLIHLLWRHVIPRSLIMCIYVVTWSGQEVSAVYLYSWAQNQALISKFAAMLKQMATGFVMCCGATSTIWGIDGLIKGVRQSYRKKRTEMGLNKWDCFNWEAGLRGFWRVGQTCKPFLQTIFWLPSWSFYRVQVFGGIVWGFYNVNIIAHLLSTCSAGLRFRVRKLSNI